MYEMEKGETEWNRAAHRLIPTMLTTDWTSTVPVGGLIHGLIHGLGGTGSSKKCWS